MFLSYKERNQTKKSIGIRLEIIGTVLAVIGGIIGMYENRFLYDKKVDVQKVLYDLNRANPRKMDTKLFVKNLQGSHKTPVEIFYEGHIAEVNIFSQEIYSGLRQASWPVKEPLMKSSEELVEFWRVFEETPTIFNTGIFIHLPKPIMTTEESSKFQVAKEALMNAFLACGFDPKYSNPEKIDRPYNKTIRIIVSARFRE